MKQSHHTNKHKHILKNFLYIGLLLLLGSSPLQASKQKLTHDQQIGNNMAIKKDLSTYNALENNKKKALIVVNPPKAHLQKDKQKKTKLAFVQSKKANLETPKPKKALNLKGTQMK